LVPAVFRFLLVVLLQLDGQILLDQSVYRRGNRIRDGLLSPIFEHVGKLSSVE
jgi:hypothetical protein